MFGRAHERSNLDRREDGRIEEEREEARITEFKKKRQGERAGGGGQVRTGRGRTRIP